MIRKFLLLVLLAATATAAVLALHRALREM
jgi:hypothetical protein